MSDKDKMKLALAVADLVFEHGFKLALKVMTDLGKDDPTTEDIKALSDRVPHPDEL